MRKKTTVYQGKFLRFVRAERWEWVERTNCTGIVLIVGLTPSKKVLLIEQYRTAMGANVIEFPAGLVNDSELADPESLEDAAERELFEETGYRARSFERVAEGPVSPGMSSEVITFFRARGLRKAGEALGDGHEKIRVHEVPLSGARAWLDRIARRGRCVDPKVYAGLYFLTARSSSR